MNLSHLIGFLLGSVVTGFLTLPRDGITSAAVTPDQTPAAEPVEARTYENRLTPIRDAKPLLADFPQYVEPIVAARRFEAPRLVDDPDADLDVRAWRWSYNARGVIEMPNRLRAKDTAVIMVHPWAVDDEWGWKTPEPNGVVDFCTPEKNARAYRHTKEVITPFLNRLRGRAA